MEHFDSIDAAKGAPCGEPRFCGRHTASDVLVCELVEVCLDFSVEARFSPMAQNELEQAGEKDAKRYSRHA
jgi:hypothetical protein